MSAGRFRDRINVLQDSSTQGEQDADYDGEPYLKNFHADVVDVGGIATFRGQQISDQTTHVVEVREDPNKKIKANMIVQSEGEQLFIEYINRDTYGGSHVRTFLHCRSEES